MYGALAYNNVLEPLNITHRIIIRVIINIYYVSEHNTISVSIIKMYMNKKNFHSII